MFDDIKRTNTSVSLSVKAELRLSLHRVFNLQAKAVIEFDILSSIQPCMAIEFLAKRLKDGNAISTWQPEAGVTKMLGL